MNGLKLFFLATFCGFLLACQKEKTNADTLQQIIEDYHAHEGYDKKEFPLGKYTREFAPVLNDITVPLFPDVEPVRV